jgi:hypothetical protein
MNAHGRPLGGAATTLGWIRSRGGRVARAAGPRGDSEPERPGAQPAPRSPVKLLHPNRRTAYHSALGSNTGDGGQGPPSVLSRR